MQSNFVHNGEVSYECTAPMAKATVSLDVYVKQLQFEGFSTEEVLNPVYDGGGGRCHVLRAEG